MGDIRRNSYLKVSFFTALTATAFLFLYVGELVEASPVGVSVTIVVTECSDGIDNDIDSFIDYPNDPDCTDASDDDESTPPPPPPPPPLNPPSSGGGGGIKNTKDPKETPQTEVPIEVKEPPTTISFQGLAYPSSVVKILRNGFIYKTTVADLGGNFKIVDLESLFGVYNYSVKAVDVQNRESSLINFSINVPKGRSIFVGDILVPPTISISPDRILPQTPIVVSGQTSPFKALEILVGESALSRKSNHLGVYETAIPQELVKQNILIKSRVIVGEKQSSYSTSILLRAQSETSPLIKGDLNSDNRVNLVDFSIIAFWYKRTGFPDKADLNKDGLVDIRDLSILAFNWTG